MAGLYIHIPFCESRCVYCGFYSTTLSSLQERYVEAICKEMELRKDECPEPIETVYLGGGTPSILFKAELDRVFLYINKVFLKGRDTRNMEITMECNPDDICKDDFRLPELVNRVSMGAQTFSDERLRFLRRRHTSRQVRTAVQRLRDMGIGNISVDLMFGFPQETLADLNHDLDEILRLGVDHISAYSLMYEEGTPLYRLREQGKIEEIDEELSLQMYDTLIRRLGEAGFEQYEISNFARPGFRSRHNSSYWRQVPYVGIGAAAHSFNGSDTRSWNVADIRRYIASIERGERPSDSETMDEDTQYDDLITTSMRMREGLDINTLKPKYKEYLLERSKRFVDGGLLGLDGSRLHLTRAGLYISDSIMSELMW
ncbi:radical SAM family heme chaperone HemW [Prevotella sp. KH2C16]|uniref:radical SAM family heme chaperone HemW n=1 Tax=Prevotella sp. KH2C16 TaxID=1855325 RepID=UPI0008F2E45B|nr:radical SAM family heme chaperone HemW [Prevotella sp. KH2C16]SFG21923.1 oxygen-independent coproporphyrinogen-3 oxidase [Prevotella sp. KH2C16]